MTRVYPRVCGGTYTHMRKNKQWIGLSPRVRGNRRFVRTGRCSRRSIPACAGEPRHQARSRRVEEVYPRVCGGTVQDFVTTKPK